MASDPRADPEGDCPGGNAPTATPDQAPSSQATQDAVFDVADSEPTPSGRSGVFQIAVGKKKSIKRRREDTKSYLALALVVIVGLAMVGGWWGWLQGHDLKDFGTFTVPLFTLTAGALAFYDRGRGR